MKLDWPTIRGIILGLVLFGCFMAYVHSPIAADSARRSTQNNCITHLQAMKEKKQKIVDALHLTSGMPFPGDALVKIYDDPSQPEDGDKGNGGTCSYHFNAVDANPTCDYVDDKYPHKLPY